MAGARQSGLRPTGTFSTGRSSMSFGSGNDDRFHPAIPKLVEALEKRHIGRREFIRTATLLGMSAGTAVLLASCGEEKKEEQAAASGDTQTASVAPGTPKK